MKKTFILMALLASAGMFIMAGSAMAGVTGSPHDLTSYANVTFTCEACHTPHDAASLPDMPLLNHDLTVVAFGTYNSPTFDTVVTGIGNPDGPDRMCLSCHDGTVAVDEVVGKVGTVDMTTLNGGVNLVGDSGSLADQHPVSFDWDATDLGLIANPSTNLSIAKVFGTNDTVRCASCHDVHDALNGGAGSNLLRGGSASALCAECHTNK